jgi:C-terminal processing protease CtpA/Prc
MEQNQMERRFKEFLALLLVFLLLSGCKKEVLPPDPEEIKEATDVNKFIYGGLSTYYLWQGQVPALYNQAYQNNNDSLNAFLNTYKDPEELFYDLLYKYGEVDRFSLIVDDSQEIDDWLAGISESVGMDFKLYYIRSGSNDLVGVIRYVQEDSPAEKAGLKRGDIFLQVDGQQLTSLNYQTLLFTHKTYTIGFASFNGTGFTPNGRNVGLTGVKLMENPIHLDTVFIAGGLKVGYLVYNSFSNSYDSLLNTSYDIELNNVFGRFKNEGIQKLILDLRYNGGGYVSSAIYLASMIHSANTQLIFSKTKYNSLLTNYYYDQYGQNFFNDYFADVITETEETPATPINSLGLNEIYIIATSETASASEMLINGLDPYISVKHVGSNTVGKNVGSFTVKDWIDNNGTVNPSHSWAMQPIVMQIANSQDFGEFADGLAPDIPAQEYAVELLPLGDPAEDLLKACLDDIKGSKSGQATAKKDLRSFKSSDDFSPVKDMMFIKKLPPVKKVN